MKNSGLFKALLLVSLVWGMQACNTPSSTAAPTGSEAAPAPSGGNACSNPLYPVAAGATWTYSVTGLANDTYTHSITAVRPDGFSDQDAFASGATRTGEWKCDNGALIVLSPLSGPSSAITASNMTANFTTSNMTGVTLPASIKAGDTWTQAFDIEGTQSINGQDVTAKGKVTFNCTGGPAESVTVAAGTFSAVRVDCKVDLAITVNLGGLAIPTSFSGNITSWFAQGVGMVKMQGEIPNVGSSALELTSYKLP
jgi:DUF3108-like